MVIKRGDVFYADLSPVVGSEQGGIRPVLIIQNDVGNRYSPTVIAIAITSQIQKSTLPTHVAMGAEEYGLNKDHVIQFEQIKTINKSSILGKIAMVSAASMEKIEDALAISIGLKIAK